VSKEPSIVYIEYWNGKKWTPAGGPFGNAEIAWSSLGGDNFDYRVIGFRGKVLKSNLSKEAIRQGAGPEATA